MRGAKTTWDYHPDGLVAGRIDALGHTLTYLYDQARRLTDLVNENGARYRFAYDLIDRLTEETRFDGTQQRYEYDRASYVITSVEAPATPNAIITHYVHDAVGRVLERVTADTRTAFSFDAAGQLVQALSVHTGVTIDRPYDKAGRLTGEFVTAGNRSYSLRHVYDPGGNRVQTTLPDGTTLGTRYSGSGDAYQIRLNEYPIATIERDAVYREISRTQGKLATSWVFDSGGRLTRQLTGGVHGASPAEPATGPRALIDRHYRYDGAGRLSAMVDRSKALAYGYDAVDHLTRFNEERFAFDPAHNLLPAVATSTGSAGLVQNNRVIVFEDKRYSYDGHGRVVERRAGAHVVTHFKWDDEHHLIESTTHDLNGAHTTRYLYDALGRRIAKGSDRGTTWFVWDKECLIQQTSDTSDHTFLYEPGTYVPLAQTARPGTSIESGAQLYYYHCDQIGLPREMTDSEGNIAWEGEYKAWGRLSRQRADAGAVRLDSSALQP
jgi:YD repeat-containing protein